MALFFNKDKLEPNDSVYGRRVARGEIPKVPVFSNASAGGVLELQNTVRELTSENSKLRDKISKMQEYIDGLEVSMSIEETIKEIKKSPQGTSGNIFSGYSSFLKSANSGSSDTSERIITDEEMENIMDYLDSNEENEHGSF